MCKSAKCHSCWCLADSYIATSHKHFRSTVAILLLISYIKARSRCLRTADFFLLMFALTTLGTPSRPLLMVAVYGLQEEHQESVSEMWILTSLWWPLNYVQHRMLYSQIFVVSDVYVFFSKYLYKITLFPFLYSLLPNFNHNSAHFQANSSVNFV